MKTAGALSALFFLLLSLLLYFSCRCGTDAGDGGGYVGPPGAILMVHPCAKPSDVSVIRQGFSTTASCPWTQPHNGVDIFTQRDRAPIQAVAQGEVEEVRLVQFPPTNWWQVNLRIRYNSTYAVGYAFELLTDQKSYGDAQYDNITRVHGITIGETVQQGRILGELLVPAILNLPRYPHPSWAVRKQRSDMPRPLFHARSQKRDRREAQRVFRHDRLPHVLLDAPAWKRALWKKTAYRGTRLSTVPRSSPTGVRAPSGAGPVLRYRQCGLIKASSRRECRVTRIFLAYGTCVMVPFLKRTF
jgi:hypothetical protein